MKERGLSIAPWAVAGRSARRRCSSTFGLGKAVQIVSIEIWWPGGSRTPQTFTNVGKNQFLEIKEFAAEYTKLERHPVRLGGGKAVR